MLEDIPYIWWIVGIICIGLIFIILADSRDNWNPPIRGKATPRTIKTKQTPPYTDRGRPVILDNASHVKEEIKEFYDFLRHAGGSVLTKKGKIPIQKTDGRLVSWSYRPFREGYWDDFVISGIKKPEAPFWFGEYSLIPNPQKIDGVQSPMTLVTGEEDILRFVGGGGILRIFSSAQPTFPKFNCTEHGDKVSNQVKHLLKGEEFEVPQNTTIIIPRGWAYRIKLNEDCVGVIRIPVLTFLSWIDRKVCSFRYRFTSSNKVYSLEEDINQEKYLRRFKRRGRDDDIESVISDDGSVGSSNESES